MKSQAIWDNHAYPFGKIKRCSGPCIYWQRNFCFGMSTRNNTARYRCLIQSELIISKFEAHINSPSKAIFSAKAAEGVVRYMMLAWEDLPAEVKGVKPLELKRIYVLQKYHGSGIAQALMTEAKSFAGRQDNDVMWLGVSKQNPRGIAFYNKQGFEVVGEQRFTVGQDIHEDLIMASSLVSHFTSQLS